MTGRETIGSRLAQLRREKAARERRDIPQNAAAEELGASAAAYSRWESDLRKPNDAWLGRLASYYGTTVPFIHYGVGGNEKPADMGGLDDVEVGAVQLTPAQLARAEEAVAAKEAARRQASTPARGATRGGTKRTNGG